jgi:hypothetical protein
MDIHLLRRRSTMPDSPNRYQTAWERFWSRLSGDPNDVLWDVDPAQAAALDLARFQTLFDPQLPVIDVGCGSGIQTRFLAQHFAQVIGVDVAPSVIAYAQTTNPAPNIRYQVFDLLSAAAGARLHTELGDANIYMRGVLMQFSADDRTAAAATLKDLLGARGVLYLNEYPPSTKAYYGSLFERQGMPAAFARVLEAGITPGGLAPAELSALFPAQEFDVLAQGDHVMHTSIPLTEGGFAQAPAVYMAVRRRG